MARRSSARANHAFQIQDNDPPARARAVDRAPQGHHHLRRSQVDHTGHLTAASPGEAYRPQASWALDGQLDLNRDRRGPGLAAVDQQEIGTMPGLRAGTGSEATDLCQVT